MGMSVRLAVLQQTVAKNPRSSGRSPVKATRPHEKEVAGFALSTTIVLLLISAFPLAHAEETEASRAARWQDVARAVFPNKTVQDDSGLLQLDAPPRALDAALVPVTITADPSAHVQSLTLVVDDNPAPVAATVHFGPLADPHILKLRIRVDQYTLIHAVAELQDGRLISTARFIKAAGGCSAPGTTNMPEALARMGRMRLHVDPPQSPGGAQLAQLLISHPNFNGMQMDPISRLYTPARYVQTVHVTQAGQTVFTLDGDISLAQDPAITFAFHPASKAPLDVEMDDSTKTVFHSQLPLVSPPS